LNSLLDEESKKTAPYSCLLYSASTQIYIIVTKLALSSQDAGIIHESARFFHILINGEVEGVLDSKLFARSLVDMVKSTIDTKIITLGEQEEGDLVELLFEITTKIRLDPDILPAWFYPSRSQQVAEQNGWKDSEFAGASRRTDFPLFYLLIDYVYHDGRTGDFARTGLLYLTEAASKSKEVEKWMIESDLATLMASGLGALYSRLSRRLPSIEDGEELPPILALSDYSTNSDGTASSIQSFRHDMNAFLSYLLFWQDTLTHCQSLELKDTLLDHFQVLFLQQLLYPSLLESSDINEGSTASVITYLYLILESLDQHDLVGRILKYLLASKDQAMNRTKARKQRMSLSRRKSFDALTALAQARDNPSPELFNLLDLVMMSLKSKHSQTVAASLKLISVIQQRHHRYAWTSFIHTRTENAEMSLRKLPELNAHLQRLMSLAPVFLDDGLIDQSYSEILQDVLDSLETHSCSTYSSQEETLDKDQEKHMTIVEDDLLLTQIKALLRSFFANDTMTNLALTEAIISIASCPLTSLDGWLLSGSTPSVKPSIIAMLECLVEQVGQWRYQIPEWDSLIALQKSNLNDQNREYAEIESGSARSRPSIDLDPPPSKPSPSRPSMDVPNQSYARRGRRSPRNLHSETFGSIDTSVASSPVPTKHPPHLDSPLRQSLYHPPSGSPTSRTTSRSASDTPYDPLQTRLSITRASTSKPTFLDRALRGHSFAASDGPSSPGPGTPSGQGNAIEDDDGGGDVLTATTASKTVSLSHVLVNAIILQGFILEVAAVVQVRACLWGEVEL
jgi:hypothetical protein